VGPDPELVDGVEYAASETRRKEESVLGKRKREESDFPGTQVRPPKKQKLRSQEHSPDPDASEIDNPLPGGAGDAGDLSKDDGTLTAEVKAVQDLLESVVASDINVTSEEKLHQYHLQGRVSAPQGNDVFGDIDRCLGLLGSQKQAPSSQRNALTKEETKQSYSTEPKSWERIIRHLPVFDIRKSVKEKAKELKKWLKSIRTECKRKVIDEDGLMDAVFDELEHKKWSGYRSIGGCDPKDERLISTLLQFVDAFIQVERAGKSRSETDQTTEDERNAMKARLENDFPARKRTPEEAHLHWKEKCQDHPVFEIPSYEERPLGLDLGMQRLGVLTQYETVQDTNKIIGKDIIYVLFHELRTKGWSRSYFEEMRMYEAVGGGLVRLERARTHPG